MDRQHVRIARLKIIILTLLATTWIFGSFLLATRPEPTGENTLGKLMRLPASLPSQLPKELPAVFKATTKTAPPIRMDVLRVPCWDKSQKAPTVGVRTPEGTPARWVRLIGRACELKGANEAVSVRNLSNGYMATVFANQPGDLTTDFIPLQVGRNDILIRFEPEPGVSVENQFRFDRE